MTESQRPLLEPSARQVGWLPELDWLRAAALLAVLVIHSAAWVLPTQGLPFGNPMAFVIGLMRFSVPAFVMASGFALYRRYGGQPLQTGDFLQRRWTRVLIPWLAWAPVFLLVGLIDGDVHRNPASVAVWLTYGAGHLYFLILMAQMYVVFILLSAHHTHLPAFCVGALVVQLMLGWLHGYAPVAPGWLIWPGSYLAHEEVPFWVGYFALGCYAASREEWLLQRASAWRVSLVAAALAAVAFAVEGQLLPPGSTHEGTYVYLWPTMLLLASTISLSVFMAARGFRASLSLVQPAITSVSHHSLGIYLLHPLFLRLIGLLTGGMNPAIQFASLLVGSAGLSYGMIWCLVQSRLGAMACGEGWLSGIKTAGSPAALAPARARSSSPNRRSL